MAAKWNCDSCGLEFSGPSRQFGALEICDSCDVALHDGDCFPDSDDSSDDSRIPEGIDLDGMISDAQNAWENGIRALEGD